jgi:hypothetical protein
MADGSAVKLVTTGAAGAGGGAVGGGGGGGGGGGAGAFFLHPAAKRANTIARKMIVNFRLLNMNYPLPKIAFSDQLSALLSCATGTSGLVPSARRIVALETLVAISGNPGLADNR